MRWQKFNLETKTNFVLLFVRIACRLYRDLSVGFSISLSSSFSLSISLFHTFYGVFVWEIDWYERMKFFFDEQNNFFVSLNMILQTTITSNTFTYRYSICRWSKYRFCWLMLTVFYFPCLFLSAFLSLSPAFSVTRFPWKMSYINSTVAHTSSSFEIMWFFFCCVCLPLLLLRFFSYVEHLDSAIFGWEAVEILQSLN